MDLVFHVEKRLPFKSGFWKTHFSAVLARKLVVWTVKQRKIEVREFDKFGFGVIAISRDVVSPLRHDLGLPAWPRAPCDDTDSSHSAFLM